MVKLNKVIKGDNYENYPGDQVCIARLQEGSQQAYKQIICHYQKRIFTFAFHFFKNKDDAMEIVQDTFFKLHQNASKLNQISSLQSWLYRVAHNLAIDHYRKFKKQRVEPQELYDHQQNSSENPEEMAAKRDFYEKLDSSILCLPKRQQAIFMLKHFNGLTYPEIASALNKSIGTIKSLHHRAIQSLKKTFATGSKR